MGNVTMGTKNLYHRWDRLILPVPTRSDRDHVRFYHHDLDGLTALEIFAERAVLTEALAIHIYRRDRDRLIWHDGDRQVTDRGWVMQRLEHLTAEEQRRRLVKHPSRDAANSPRRRKVA
jgi:hypothetical protein